MTTAFTLNGKKVQVETPEDSTLLWALREHLQLMGTKFGCGIGQCGVCTVHLDGAPVRACTTPVSGAAGKSVTTIEGLSEDGSHPLQKAWVEAQAPQCGYCQPGQIMQAAALLQKNPKPSREEIKKHMNDVICRCGTYLRIIKAIEMASEDV
jgi:isoquinoline 1-oxidoreductase alpha subunit